MSGNCCEIVYNPRIKVLKPTVKVKGHYWEKISRPNVKVKQSCKKVHELKKREEEVMFYNKISPIFLFNDNTKKKFMHFLSLKGKVKNNKWMYGVE